MATKQFGKLRQWAGEVISTRDKTSVTDDFKELEHDIEVRKEGMHRIQIASEDYHHAISKKRESEAVEITDKLLPIDGLGIAMVNFGEKFSTESAFGDALVKLGRAHCRIATLQEGYAITFNDSYMESLHRFSQDIIESEAARKKLESRRLSYDASMSKLDKIRNNKKAKEKDLQDATDEHERAKERYEETLASVEVQMRTIQEDEIQQLHDLTAFFRLQMHFVKQYYEVLVEVNETWPDMPSLTTKAVPQRRPSATSIKNSTKSPSSRKGKSLPSSESDTESDASGGRRKRSNSMGTTKASSRAGSRSRRNSAVASDKEKESDAKEKKKDNEEKNSRRMSMAGWASSLTGRNKKDKEKFTALLNQGKEGESGDEKPVDEAETDRSPSKQRSAFPIKTSVLSSKKHKSKESLTSKSPKANGRLVSSSSPSGSLSGPKLVRALYDFSSTSVNELSFRTGDEIVVVNEVLDEWWLGRLNDKEGLFPTTYTEIIAKPPLPKRPLLSHSSSLSSQSGASQTVAGEEQDMDNQSTSDHESGLHPGPFSDHHYTTAQSPIYSTFNDSSSFVSADSAAEEDDERQLVPKLDRSPSPSLRQTVLTRSAPPPIAPRSEARKAPPPPPPPRRAGTMSKGSSSVPSDVRPTVFRSHSTSEVIKQTGSGASPFEEAEGTHHNSFSSEGCTDFRQNPFKPHGMCSNCFEYHN